MSMIGRKRVPDSGVLLRTWCLALLAIGFVLGLGACGSQSVPAQAAADEPTPQVAPHEAVPDVENDVSPAEPEPDPNKDIMVPMRDGTGLRTDVYLPPGDGPFPVVIARTVYDKEGLDFFADFFTPHGMAVVCQDTRGRSGSEGEDRVFLDDGWGENRDGVDTLRWVKEQPWCNGNVATFGMSALGITSTLMAPESDLECQCIWVAPSTFYGQLTYQGGVFRKALCEDWTRKQGNFYIIETWHAHPTYDAFWEGFDAETRASDFTAPGMHVGGWWDIFADGTIRSFLSRQRHGGEGAKGNQILVMGPWTHAGVMSPPECGDLVRKPNYLLDTRGMDLIALSVNYVKHYLVAPDERIADLPAVIYYTLGDMEAEGAPGNEWREADDWPPFETTPTAFHLAAGEVLTRDAPTSNDGAASDDAAVTFTYDPANPCPTHGGARLDVPAGPFDQKELAQRPDVLAFMTEPLDEPVEVTGRVSVRLFVSSDAPDTDFTAKLLDVYPDGRQILMLDNIQRLKFRNGFTAPDPLPIGEVGEVTIDLGCISLIVNEGHRIGLHVSSSNFDRFETNPNTGEDFPTDGGELRVAHNTVHMSKQHPSALILPIRP